MPFSLLGVAVSLLKACRGNLEMALNLHFNKQEILPELDKAVGEVAMETSSSMTESEVPSSLETANESGAIDEYTAKGINESILSLLVKLRSSMINSSSSSPGRLVKVVFKKRLLSWKAVFIEIALSYSPVLGNLVSF